MNQEHERSQSVTSVEQQRRDDYESNGYLVMVDLLPANVIEQAQLRLKLIAAGECAGFPDDQIELEPGSDRSWKSVRKINRCTEYDRPLMNLAVSQPILDIVSDLLGPDIKLFGSQCFMKPPGGVEKPFHQDSAYFPIDPPNLVTCWIALDDVTIENGCVWVIPGSHRGEIHEHSLPWQVGDRIDQQVPPELIDQSRESPLVMRSGSCSFHHSKLLHRSGPNRTSTHRRGLAVHYMSARSRWTDSSQQQPDFPLAQGRRYEGCV